MEALWDAVDNYFAERLAPSDAALEQALAESAAGGLPAIAVTPTQGKFLQLLAQLRGARRILEIGTLGGYSTIWMARALAPNGKLITLEIDAHHATVARQNIERAHLSDRIEVVVAPAMDSLEKMSRDGVEPFDMVFIDADKANIDRYFTAALALARPGTVIVVDNVVRKGAVVDSVNDGADVQGIRRFVEGIRRNAAVSATAIQTVGSKGFDGFVIAIVKG